MSMSTSYQFMHNVLLYALYAFWCVLPLSSYCVA